MWGNYCEITWTIKAAYQQKYTTLEVSPHKNPTSMAKQQDMLFSAFIPSGA